MIKFIGNTQSSFGRGKDKAKRKSKAGLAYGVVNGLATGKVSGLAASTVGGALIDRKIEKEKLRFEKEGARSRLGKIGSDAKTGAKIGGATSALQGAYIGARATKGSLKQKLQGAGLAALGSGIGGAIGGGVTGAGVGAVRGFLQPNKKKKNK